MENNLRRAVEASNNRFMEAFNRGDAAGVAACYTEHARILPPGGEMMQGRANIQTFWHGVITSGVTEARLETLDVEAGGDVLVREIGQFRLTIVQNNETVYSTGKYVVIWRRDGDSLRMDVDIWNS